MQPAKVFISYSAPDRHVISQLAEDLETTGAEVWYAGRNLPPGKQISEVFHQIGNADFVLIGLSKASVPSAWVSAETQGALAAMRAGRAVRVIPIRLETVDPPIALADTVSIDLRPSSYEAGISRLRSVILGKDDGEGDEFSRFRQFTERLIVVSADAARICRTLGSFLRPDTAADTRAQARAMIDEELVKSGISEADRNKIVTDIASGKIPLIMAATELEDVRWFTRYVDAQLMRFAGDLYRQGQRGMQGVTFRDVVDFVRQEFHEKDYESAVAKAESLFERARDMRLLARSTENPQGYAALDAQENPSYDMGEMVRVVGRLVGAFKQFENGNKALSQST
jgi:hypothetical protein